MIKSHVTNLELSRRWAELGVPQISFYHWVNVNSNTHLTNTICSAYLASELGKWIDWRRIISWGLSGMACLHDNTKNSMPDYYANLLILLIENGHIKIEDLK